MRRPRSSRSGGHVPVLALTILFLASSAPGRTEVPGREWSYWETPEEAGFSSREIAEARVLWEELDASFLSAFFLVHKGKVLAEWGNPNEHYEVFSIWKSYLSALYGAEVENGTIDLDSTIEELGIDDDPPLTQEEKQATVRHLLQSRSGVYHQAACEGPEDLAGKPSRGSHPPGTFWHYNNWGFNALATIYLQETGKDIFREFDSQIAKPLAMEDFKKADCRYGYQYQYSIHPCASFRMTPRDMARFGLLFLEKGRWGADQIVSESWFEESTRGYSETDLTGYSYGYLWWSYAPEFFQEFFSDERLYDLQAFAAQGWHGQMIFIVPDAEMVMVTTVHTTAGSELDAMELLPIVQTLFTAKPPVDLEVSKGKAKPGTVSPGTSLRLSARVRNLSQDESELSTVSFYLAPEGTLDDDARLIATAELGSLLGRKKKKVKINATVPTEITPGTYVLLVTVDDVKSNYDLNRGNNIDIAKKTVQIR